MAHLLYLISLHSITQCLTSHCWTSHGLCCAFLDGVITLNGYLLWYPLDTLTSMRTAAFFISHSSSSSLFFLYEYSCFHAYHIHVYVPCWLCNTFYFHFKRHKNSSQQPLFYLSSCPTKHHFRVRHLHAVHFCTLPPHHVTQFRPPSAAAPSGRPSTLCGCVGTHSPPREGGGMAHTTVHSDQTWPTLVQAALFHSTLFQSISI